MKNRDKLLAISIIILLIAMTLLVIYAYSLTVERARPTPSPSPSPTNTKTASPTPTLSPSPTPTATPAYPTPTSLGLKKLWRFAARDTVWDMTLANLTGREFTDIVIASYDNQLYALDSAGKLRWQFATQGPVFTAVAVDLDGDGLSEIVLGNDANTLYALDSDKTILWQHDTATRVTTLTAADLTGGGVPDIIAGVWDGTILAFDASGTLFWQTDIAGTPAQIHAASLDEDAAAEVIVATDTGAVVALRGDGQIWWEKSITEAGQVSNLSLAVADLNDDEQVEIIAATSAGTVVVLNGDGTERWRVDVGAAISALHLGDVNDDSIPEILIGTGPTAGQVVVLTATGEPRGRTELSGAIWALATADLDDDGAVEIIAGADDGIITILDKYGQRRGTYATPARVHGISYTQARLIVHSGDYVYALSPDSAGEAGEPRPADPPTLSRVTSDILDTVGQDEIELLAMGDVMLSRSIARRATLFGAQYPFAATAPLLRRADIVVANLECALTTQGEPAGKSFVLRAHPHLAAGIRDAGIGVITLSNNHVLDFGAVGLADTIAALDEHDIKHTGAGANWENAIAPAVVEVKGMRVAFLAFTNAAPDSWYAGATSPGVTLTDVNRMAIAIEQARQEADFVVVSLHALVEYKTEVREIQRQLARAAIDAGAVLVIGHGPHVLQETEQYGDGFIAYSLGNFVFDIDIDDAARDGAILRVVLGRVGLRQVDLLPTRIIADVQPRLVADSAGAPVVHRLFPIAEPTLTSAVENVAVTRNQVTAKYDFDLSLDYEKHYIEAREHVAVVNDTLDNWDEIVFSVPPAYWQDTFSLSALEVISGENANEVVPEWRGTMLHLPLLKPLSPGETVKVSIDFALQLPAIDATAWPPLGNLGWAPRVMQVGEWYPALVPYRAGEGWLTWEYHPVGDPTVNGLGDYNVRIVTNEEVTIAASGLVAHEGNSWRFHLEEARSFAFLASPKYQITRGMAGNVPIHSYYLDGYETAGLAVRDVAARAVTLFSELYGDYPYPELVVAQNGYYGAMEYSGLCSQTNYAYETYNGEAASLLVSLVAHEIAHQWWYGAVGNDQVREPWLDESLAMYSELLYYEHYHPELVEWWWDFRVDQWQPGGMVDITIYDYGDTRTYAHKMYGQAAHFIADLRALMGDEAFFAFLKEYRAANEGRIVNRADFFAAVRAHTDDNLSLLLEQYFK